jgi:hypothetical protein
MKPVGRPQGAKTESYVCPVCGREVTCQIRYHTGSGKPTLTYFECAMEGLCGIPSWDPCPVYARLVGGTGAA